MQDLRCGQTYRQIVAPGMPVVREATVSADGRALAADLWEPSSDSDIGLSVSLPAGKAEVRCELSGAESEIGKFVFPGPFATAPGEFLVIPMNEGILYPVDDSAVAPLSMEAYSGSMMSMPWFGQIRGEAGPGVMTILETRADAGIRVDRPLTGEQPLLCAWPFWEPSRGSLRYNRVARHVLFGAGGYVAQAKRYRDHAQAQGLLTTLAEKRRRNPLVDALVGTPHVWARYSDGWNDGEPEHDPVRLIAEMKGLGISRLLFNGDATPAATVEMNDRWPDVISSRYNNFQDTWAPGKPAIAPYHEGYPEDVALRPDGSHQGGWPWPENGVTHVGSYICSSRMTDHARRSIVPEQAYAPFRGRFLDTTGATPWLECHSPDHPQSRSDDCASRNRMLEYVSGAEPGQLRLITGTETGIDATVPGVHYYEGMLSLHAYMLPPNEDLGDLGSPVTPTAEYLRYNASPYYRVPLFELVFHDCVQSTWWWGDSNGRIPELWDGKDLVNALYGTNPLFYLMGDGPNVWEKTKQRYARTYETVCTWVHRIGYDEMLSHEFLTPDHTLQRTTWSSGWTCVANWSREPQTVGERTVPGLRFITYQ